MNINIEVFGPLTEYFEPRFQFNLEYGTTVDDLLMELINKEVFAKEIIISSAIAQGDEMVDKDYKLQENDHISILPPPSGG